MDSTIKNWTDRPPQNNSNIIHDENKRFINIGNGTVIDELTSLMWTYDVYPMRITMVDASLMEKSFAGYSDWRIPTYEELRELTQKGYRFVSRGFGGFCWTTTSAQCGNNIVLSEEGVEAYANPRTRYHNLRLVRVFERCSVKIELNKPENGEVYTHITQKDDNKLYLYNNSPPFGTKVVLNAKPKNGVIFKEWHGDASGTNPNYTLTIDGPKFIVAKFEQLTYSLTIQTTGSGEGSITPSTTVTKHPYGSVVALTATAAKGSRFKQWGGDAKGLAHEIRITLDGHKTVIAEFVRLFPFAIFTSGSGMGTVQCSNLNDELEAGSTVDLIAIPDRGHKFVQWSGDASGTDINCTVTMNGPKSVTVEFEQLTYSLTLQTTGSGEGSITPSSEADQHPHGSSITLRAIAAKGSKFKQWGGGVSGTNIEATFKIKKPTTVTAEFVRMYPLSVSTQGKGRVKRSVDASELETGSSITLTAIPADGHEFIQWHGAATGTNPVCTLAMNAAKTVKAEFRQLPTFNLEVTHIGTGRGAVLPDQKEYWKGSVVNLVAQAAEGCVFDGWAGDIEGLEIVRQVTLNSNLAITATFNRVEAPETGIAVVFDSVTFFNTPNADATVFQFTVSNHSDRQIRLEIPLAGFVTARGEEVEQAGWVKGLIDGEKGVTLRAGTFRKMGLAFDRRQLANVALGEHLHITLLQNKPAQRLTFTFRCTDTASQALALVKADVEPLTGLHDNNESSGNLAAQAELAARMQLLEKSLQEALSRLSAAPAAPPPTAAPTQTLPEILAWLCTQNSVPAAVLRQKLLPLGLMPSAVMDDVNERAFDVAGEPALEEAADTVTVQRGVLLQVLAVWQ